MLWQELTMSELGEKLQSTRTAILPVGATEEHGPHLPLGLDAMHAEALAAKTAGLHPCLVMPGLSYGLCRSSGQHLGTVGISGQAVRLVVYDLATALWQQGIKCLCIVTGHAGGTHGAALVDAGEQLLKDTGLEIAVVCVLDLLKEAADFLECKGDSHAGEVETSLAMHLWPGLVKGSAPEEYPTFDKFILSRDKLKHWPGGVWGNPAAASPDKGRRILEIEARALAEILARLEAKAARQDKD